jgi:hypothetical protein
MMLTYLYGLAYAPHLVGLKFLAQQIGSTKSLPQGWSLSYTDEHLPEYAGDKYWLFFEFTAINVSYDDIELAADALQTVLQIAVNIGVIDDFTITNDMDTLTTNTGIEYVEQLNNGTDARIKYMRLPANATNAITMNELAEGNLLVNFHNESKMGRYYKKNTYNSLPRKKNPYTRKNILDADIKTYIATFKPMTHRRRRSPKPE